MTIDEAIKHAEEVAEENENKAQIWHKMAATNSRVVLAENYCVKCAKEHRQLAEWLKELKQLREQEPFINKPCVAHKACHEDKVKVLDKIRADIVDTLYIDSLIFGELIDFRNGKISADDVIEEFNRVTKLEVLKILDKYKEVEE